jgi:dimethylargininase
MDPRPAFSRRLLSILASALATGVATFVAVVFVFFLAFQANPASFPELALFFGPAAIVLVVLLAVAGLSGAFTSWHRLLPVSFVATLVAAYLGTVIVFVREGGDFSTSSQHAFGQFIGNNLPFVIVAVVASLTVGRWVFSWASGLRLDAPTPIHRVALVRPPASTLAKGEITHIKRKPVRLELAETQWEAYVAALEAEGFTTVEIESSDDHPDSVFIEDTVVMLGQSAVIGSPGAESRRGEPDAVAAAVADLGLQTHQIRLPGTLDGGDVLKVGSTIYVGRGGRTNAEGIRQFRAIAGQLGYTVVAVPVTKALHLKSAVTALPDGTVIGHKTLVDNPAIFDRYLEVPEVAGVAVVVLSPNAVLMSSAAPKTAALIADLGYRVVTVDISEFEKLEGCVTCLSVRIR